MQSVVLGEGGWHATSVAGAVNVCIVTILRLVLLHATRHQRTPPIPYTFPP